MPSLQSQLRRDLHHRIDDKLFLWVKDAAALYDMADLATADLLEDVFMSIFSCIGAVAAAYSLEPEPIVKTLRKTLEISQRKHDEHEKESR